MTMTSAPRSTTCTLAVVSLCFGIAAWTVLPFIGAIVAVICGHLAAGKFARPCPSRSTATASP